MHRHSHLVPSAALALLAAACSAPHASIMPMLGNLGLDGSFAASDSSTAVATSFSELGIDDNEAAPGAKVNFGFAGANLSVSAFKTSYEGRGTARGEIEIGSGTISAGAEVDTELDLAVGRAMFTWNLVPVGPLEFGLGVGLSVIDFDLMMRETMSGERLESDEALPIPLIAARAAWTWGPVKLNAEVGGLAIEIDGDEAQVIDGEVEASVGLFDGGSLAVGYRLLDIDAEYEPEEGDMAEADFELSGFYFGVRFSF